MIAEIPDLVAKRAELGPERVALENSATGHTVTYAQLDARAASSSSLP